MTDREASCWRKLIRLANADPSDDTELVVAFTRALRVVSDSALGTPLLVPTLDGTPAFFHPGLAREACRVQPELRLLLRLAASAGTRAQRKRARQVIAQSRSHEAKWEKVPAALRGKIMKPLSDFRFLQSKQEKDVVYLDGKSEGPKERMPPRYQVPLWCGPLDPWCGFIRDVLARRGREPIRLCRLGGCGRFFMRDRKRAFCSPGCKLKFHESARRWSRPKRRDYQYRYRAEKLLAAGGAPAIKSRMEQVERGKISAEKKRRLLAILGTIGSRTGSQP
jgi:hypothetical protein